MPTLEYLLMPTVAQPVARRLPKCLRSPGKSEIAGALLDALLDLLRPFVARSMDGIYISIKSVCSCRENGLGAFVANSVSVPVKKKKKNRFAGSNLDRWQSDFSDSFAISRRNFVAGNDDGGISRYTWMRAPNHNSRQSSRSRKQPVGLDFIFKRKS